MGVDQPECGAARSSPAKWSNTNTGEKNSEQPNVAGQFKPFGSANSRSPERCPPVQAFWKRNQLPAKYSLESVVSPG